MVVTAPLDVNISLNDKKKRDLVKEYIASRNTQHSMEVVDETIVDMAAPGTQATRKRIEELWLMFLEEKGFQCKWDHEGPTIGMYIDIRCFSFSYNYKKKI